MISAFYLACKSRKRRQSVSVILLMTTSKKPQSQYQWGFTGAKPKIKMSFLKLGLELLF